MKRGTLLNIVLLIVFIVLLFTYIARSGRYPIALVHGDWITSRSFRHDYNIYNYYYQKATQINRLTIADNNSFQKQIGREGFNRIIENTLIDRALKDLNDPATNQAVKDKINKDLNNADVVKLENILQGVSKKDFIRIILEPEAKKEALSAYLLHQEQGSEPIDNWLSKTKRAARIIIFSDTYDWDGEKVILKSGS